MERVGKSNELTIILKFSVELLSQVVDIEYRCTVALPFNILTKSPFHQTHRQLMSVGTGALKVSGEGPQGCLHGNPASRNHPSSSR